MVIERGTRLSQLPSRTRPEMLYGTQGGASAQFSPDAVFQAGGGEAMALAVAEARASAGAAQTVAGSAQALANEANSMASSVQGIADAALAAADNALTAAVPLSSYADALIAAQIPFLSRVSAIIDGRLVEWVRQTGGPCLGGGWVPAGDVFPEHFNARPNASTAPTAHAATLALQAAYEWAAGNGRPLRLGAQTWVVHLRPEDVSGSVSTYRQGALLWDRDDAVVLGEGIGKTTIRNFDTGGTYSVIQMIRLPLQNGIPKISGGLLADFTADENCADTLQWDGRIAAVRTAGLKDFTFERIKFCNSGHYGLGMQNGGYVNVTVADCQFDNTGKDAIDIKNNVEAISFVSSTYGIKILRPWVKNCCRAMDPTASAAIDTSGWGVIIDSPFFDGVPTDPDANYSSLIRFKEGLDPNPAARGLGAQGGRVINPTVKFYGGAEKAPQIGLIEIRAPYVTVTDLMVYGTPPSGTIGVQTGMAYTTVRGGRFSGLANGVYNRVRFTGPEWSPFEGGEDLVVEDAVFENCAVGVLANRRRTRIVGNRFPGCAVGVQGASSDSVNMTIVGNNFAGCATPYLLNVSSGHVIENNTGAAGFSTFSIAVGGEQRHAVLAAWETIRIGLNYTGDPASIREALRVSGAANDVNYMHIASATANSPPQILAQGSDANIDLRLSPKGTGRLRFGALVAQEDSPVTGYIEIKDSAGVLRRLAVVG